MKVFVYGSLKKGFYNHSLLGNSKFLGKDKVRGKLHSLGPFPGLLLTKDDYFAQGEVYEVTDKTLRVLDQLEGYFPKSIENSLYFRKEVEVLITDASGQMTVTKAYVYFYNSNIVGEFIETGIWEEDKYKGVRTYSHNDLNFNDF